MRKLLNKLRELFNKIFRRKQKLNKGVPLKPRLVRIKTFRKTKFWDMPRYQPCPNGHGMKRIRYKTIKGAMYNCNKCGIFFVRH